jgi:hypothetical protein
MTDLDDLKQVICKYFPELWFEVKACLSTIAILTLKNMNGCPTLILVGSPSSQKTTILSFFYNYKLTYLSDSFTPKSFVSHAANVKVEKLAEVDMLPKLVNKCLLSPELAPLFEAQKDAQIEVFSILTRVLDGEGLKKDSAVHGGRGYSGDYHFAWLGATTPVSSRVWRILGKLGNRMFFMQMNEKEKPNIEFKNEFLSSEVEYEEKVKICRKAMHSFLDKFFEKNKVRQTKWNRGQDNTNSFFDDIIEYARLLSSLRGALVVWKTGGAGGYSHTYEHTIPIKEGLYRAINALYNFARGHALLHDRNFITASDIILVRKICLSSMPHDRQQFLSVLRKYKGRVSTSTLTAEMKCSNETARKTMTTFEILGVVDVKKLEIGYENVGRPETFAEIKPNFMNLLINTQMGKSLEKYFPTKNKPVCVEKSMEDSND